MEVTSLTISQIHKKLKEKEFSVTELTKAYLEQIKKKEKILNAFISVDEEGALLQAKAVEKRIAAGNFSQLTGVPCAVKDSILVKGLRCTAGSRILENYIGVYDATVIERLKKEGCVILGKTNTDEFTMGASTENSAFGVVRNPFDSERVAGGSSGGSAAAVASGEVCYALGSDTGGSIRLPASFCGIVGLNPTYGSVSRYGLIAHASSLDQIGPMTKNVEDAEIVFKAICGKDPKDSTSFDYILKEEKINFKELRIGYPKEFFSEGLDREVEKIIRRSLKKAEEEGAAVEEISLPNFHYAIPCYYIIVSSEASANLARYDGIKYGFSEKGGDLMEVYLKSRGRGFGLETKRRIMLGTFSLSAGYYEAYYKKAQEVRQLIRQDFIKAFQRVDIIFSPVAPFPAFKIGEKIDDPLSMYLVDIYTVGVKLAGLPALSLPVGKINNLPIGLQIIGDYCKEGKIFAIAKQMENMLK